MRKRRSEREPLAFEENRRRAAAKDIYNAVGYDAMYRNGVAMVEPGLYSQTVEFSDISYQSASDESQNAICKRMRTLYNGLTADISMQMTMVNRPIHASRIGNRVFFPVRDDITGPYAVEYNRILNDKMMEGVSNLERKRYLTFTVGAPDADHAIPKLARARSAAAGVLASIRSDARTLDGAERLKVMAWMLRPGSPDLRFDWGEIGPTTGMTTKDCICPDAIDFKPGGSGKCFTIDGVWCQVLAMRRFESNLSDRCMADMIDLPIPLVISIHVRPMESNKANAFVRQRLAWIDKEVAEDQMTAVKKGYDYSLLPPELRYTREEAQDLYDRLKDDSQQLFWYTGLVMTYASTRDKLDEQVMQLVGVAQSNGIELAPLDYRQREGLNSILPLGRNHVDVSRFMLTDEVAIQSPFATLELNQPGGGYYGQNRHSRNLVIANRKTMQSRMGIYCGKPGSGKSFGAKREMENTILLYPDDDIVIVDPAGEFPPICEANGGEVVYISPETTKYLNPLDLADVAGQTPVMQMALKIEAILALSSASMVEGGEDLRDVERSIISRCLEVVYARSDEKGETPQLEDFYEELRRQPEAEAEVIALRFERYVHGALSVFNHQSTFDFDKRLTCFVLKDLPENMRAFGMVAVLEAVRNRMYRNFECGRTTWLYVDEMQGFFGHPATIEYFSRFTAEGRKFNLLFTGISQNATYILDHPQGRNIILNADFDMLYQQSYADRDKWAQLLNLSEQEIGYIDDSVKPGEGLLIAGGARVPIVDDFPRGALYDLFNTKPDEIAELKRARNARRGEEEANGLSGGPAAKPGLEDGRETR